MTEETEEQPVTELRKTRKCLRCRERFESEWAGERICPRCKSSQAWKSGYERPFA
ncbi:MAG: hypothetical protein R3316_02110 [Rhodovibrionaceae bacterium]|nr:hypothetical protein [Rhodovibrionaceae bacterium]